MKSKWLLIFFVTDCVADLAFIYFQKNEWRYISKPLLVIFLILYAVCEIKKKTGSFFLLLSALLFSFVGDVVLLFENISSCFIIGLISFLVAHVFYILLFLKIKKQNQADKKLNIVATLLLIGYFIFTLVFLKPFLGDFLIPVIVYTVVILSMFHASVHAFDFKRQDFGRLCIIGAAIFVLSDSTLAVNKFYHSFNGAPLMVMVTYSLAQLLIVLGATKYLNSVYND